MVSWRGRVLKSHGNRNRRNSTATCWKRTSRSHVFNCTTVNKENTHANKKNKKTNSLGAVSCKWTMGILLTRQAEWVPAGEYTSPSALMETGITSRWHLWSTSKLRKMWWTEEGVFSRSGWQVVCSNCRWPCALKVVSQGFLLFFRCPVTGGMVFLFSFLWLWVAL